MYMYACGVKCARWQERRCRSGTRKHPGNEAQIYVHVAKTKNIAIAFSGKKQGEKEKKGKVHRKGEKVFEIPRASSPVICVK